MAEALDLLGTLLDRVSVPALMVLLGLLDDAELPEDIRRAVGETLFASAPASPEPREPAAIHETVGPGRRPRCSAPPRCLTARQ